MADPVLVQGAREIIARRAWWAGMDYDPSDLVDHYEAGAHYVFLRRIRHPEYDEEGQFLRWRYEDLAWAEHRLPEAKAVSERIFKVTKFLPRVVFRCPWLAAKVTDDGEVIFDA